MYNFLPALASILSILLPPSAAIAEDLKPVSKWSVGYEPAMCTLSRQFGSAEKPVLLAFRPYIGSEEEQIAVLLPPSADRGTKRGRGRIVLQPSGQAFATLYAAGPLPKGDGRRAINIDVDQASVRTKLETATAMVVEAAGQSHVFRLSGTGGALTALKACEDDLLRGWGADPAAMIGQDEAGSLGTWFSRDNYPKAALARRATGRVRVIVDVGPDGRTTACRVLETSGDRDLDAGTCAILMKRGDYPRASVAKRSAIHAIRWSIE